MTKKKNMAKSCCCCHHQNVFISMVDNDVILEILVQLPPISVVRFKLVSKTWYALISDSNFLVRHSLHYHRYIQETRRIDRLSDGLCFGPFLLGGEGGGDGHPSRLYSPFQHQPDYLIFPPPPPPNPNPNHHHPPPILRILNEDNHPLSFFPIINMDQQQQHPMAKFSFFTLSSFSNGLVIFRGHNNANSYTRFQQIHDSTYFLCNPILKQYIELPRINPIPDMEELLRRYYLCDSVEDYLEPTYIYEPIIVFDPTTISLSYKVIRFLVCKRHGSDWLDFSLQIYAYSQPSSSSSSSSLWRLITTLPDWKGGLVSGNGVLLNGVLYHLCSAEVIICIHVAKEIVWVLDCPSMEMTTTTYRYQYFGECGGHLQLVAQYYDTATFSFPCSFDVFEMEQQQQQQQHDDDQEVVHSAVWILKYRVRNIRPQPYYDHILREHSIHIIRLFKTGRRGEEEEEALLMKIFPMAGGNGMVLIFNLTINTFGELLDIHIPFDHVPDRYVDVFPYTMTLFPLCSSS